MFPFEDSAEKLKRPWQEVKPEGIPAGQFQNIMKNKKTTKGTKYHEGFSVASIPLVYLRALGG